MQKKPREPQESAGDEMNREVALVVEGAIDFGKWLVGLLRRCVS